MSKKTLFENIEDYKWIFPTWEDNKRIAADDVSDAIYFVAELLMSEAEAVEEKEPYATNTIRKLRDVAYYLQDMAGDSREIIVGNMD